METSFSGDTNIYANGPGHIVYLTTMYIWVATCNFQKCVILTCVDSDEPVQPP